MIIKIILKIILILIKKNSEIKNKLGEDLDKIKEEYNNYRTKTMEEIKELKENKQKEIEDIFKDIEIKDLLKIN